MPHFIQITTSDNEPMVFNANDIRAVYPRPRDANPDHKPNVNTVIELASESIDGKVVLVCERFSDVAGQLLRD